MVTTVGELKVLMTPEDLAQVISVSHWSILKKLSRRLRSKVKFDLPPGNRIGKQWRFEPEDVE